MTIKEARETYEAMSEREQSDVAQIMILWLNSSPEKQAEIFDLAQKLLKEQLNENE